MTFYRHDTVRGDSESDADGLDLRAPTDWDRRLLEDEEQEEKLLLGTGHNGRTGGPAEPVIDTGRREQSRNLRRQRRRRKRKATESRDEEGKLMYEMEEGGSKTDGSSHFTLIHQSDSLLLRLRCAALPPLIL